MIPPRKLALYKCKNGGVYLQAATESMIGLHLGGKIQAGLVLGKWMDEGRVLGYYEGYRPEPGKAWRRITGGPTATVNNDTDYLSVVFASESLEETAGKAQELSSCLNIKVWGVTRMGPRPLAAGVIEAFGSFKDRDAVECVKNVLGGRVEETHNVELDRIKRIARAYIEKGWIEYSGAAKMAYSSIVSRGDYYVRMGVAVVEGFISNALIDGVFYAAPPNEPFNTVAALRGMPVGDQALLLLEARLGIMELYGIKPSDVIEAYLEAVEKASQTTKSARGETST